MVIGSHRNTVRWKNNAQGFRNDYDVTTEPGPGVVRLMSIGDSFTAGYRLAQNETFSFLLEQDLNNRSDGNKYEVLISAVGDPTTGLDYLSSSGLSFKPKLVLFGVTIGNDISQAYVNLLPGGLYELDDKTGKIENNASRTVGFAHGLDKISIPAPCIANKASLLDRRSITYHLLKQLWRIREPGETIMSWYTKHDPNLFDPVHGLGSYLKEPPREMQEAYHEFFRSLRALKKVIEGNGVNFAMVIFPQRFQVQKEDWTRTVVEYGLNESCFDLNLPNRLIADFCAENDLVCIDPTPTMVGAHSISRKSLYLPKGDMHMNAEGNRVVFEAIKDEVYRQLRAAGRKSDRIY